MAKVSLMSDVHVEFHPDKGKSFIANLKSKDIDVMVLAGDIASYTLLEDTLKRFSAKFKHVVYVLGNHEYYGHTPLEVHDKLDGISINNLHILRNKSILLEGIEFIGSTLWFRNYVDNHMYKKSMADFFIIKEFEPWVYNQNIQSESFIKRALKLNGTDVPRIVVTHHLPTEQAIFPPWTNNKLNRFFMTPLAEDILSESIKLPDYWFYGHTHACADYTWNNCRFITNPKGYPGESIQGYMGKTPTPFNESLILDIK